MSSIAERINSRITTLKEKSIKAGEERAREDMKWFEEELFEAYCVLGTKNFTISILFTVNGDFHCRFCYDGKNFPRKYDENRRNDYVELSELERKFYQEAYQSVWQAEGIKLVPFRWYNAKFFQLFS